jgi:nitrous oxidase accessory protein NosD
MHLRGQQSFGIHSRARTFVIKDCTLQGSGNETGIWLWGVDPLLGGGRIESNRIAGYRDNIYIEYSVGMVIKDNVIDSNYRGLVFTVSYYLPGGLVYGNTVHGGAEGGLWIGSAHSRVRDNTITGAGPGIGSLLGAHGNIITDNVLRDCLGSGIIAGSGMTFVDGNLSESNVPYDSWSPGCGIHLTDHNHVYRNNMLRNNPGGGVCHVGSSTDAGGNIQ